MQKGLFKNVKDTLIRTISYYSIIHLMIDSLNGLQGDNWQSTCSHQLFKIKQF